MTEKKKKPFCKKWWFIVIAVVIVIGAIGSQGDETKKGDVNIEEASKVETKAEEKEVKETEPAEITEQMKLDYESNIYNNMNDYMAIYDALLVSWQETMTGVGEGTMSMLDGYNSVKELNERYYALWKQVSSLKPIEGMSKDDKEVLTSIVNSFEIAIVQWQTNTKDMMKMLDKGDISNSKISKIQDNIGVADSHIAQMVVGKVILDTKFGFEQPVQE